MANQQVRTLHEPLTPWHLHSRFIKRFTACESKKETVSKVNLWLVSLIAWAMQWSWIIICQDFISQYVSQQLFVLLPSSLHGCCASSWAPVHLSPSSPWRLWRPEWTWSHGQHDRCTHPSRKLPWHREMSPFFQGRKSSFLVHPDCTPWSKCRPYLLRRWRRQRRPHDCLRKKRE